MAVLTTNNSFLDITSSMGAVSVVIVVVFILINLIGYTQNKVTRTIACFYCHYPVLISYVRIFKNW
jgi:O-antigen ligase